MKLKSIVYGTVAVLLAAVAVPTGCTLLGRSGSIGEGPVIGEVSTVWRWTGPNDKIIVEAFDDPEVAGVTCHVTRAVSGGFWYFLNMQEDPAESSVSCRRVGDVVYDEEVLKKRSGDYAFSTHTSIFFKYLQVRRFYDAKRKTLIYVVVSETLFSGSNHNAASTVPLGVQ